MNQAFTPGGPTVLIGTTPLQATSGLTGVVDPTQRTAYRVRCLINGYISWAPANRTGGGAPQGVTSTAPAAGTPSENTIGMLAGQCEIFTLPQNAWFYASAAVSFEVTPGEGI